MAQTFKLERCEQAPPYELKPIDIEADSIEDALEQAGEGGRYLVYARAE